MSGNISARTKSYWFPAKRYGWGWGPPTCWQGWFVIGAFVAALIACSILFRPRTHPLGYAACVIGLTAAVIVVAWLKGEKPKWRWGNRS
jgi:hypothetical protein